MRMIWASLLLLISHSLYADSIDDYIVILSKRLSIPVDFALSILQEENPARNPAAISRHNNDRTKDYGLWQINESNFEWMMREFGLPNGHKTFHWDNPTHSTWFALHYIHHLKTNYQFTWWQVAIAYNCGPSYVIAERPPPRSLDYAERVMSRTWGLGGR